MKNVGNRWENELGWVFHAVNKGIIRNFLSSDEEDYTKLKDIKYEDWWTEGLTEEDKKNGLTDPRNVEFLRGAILGFEKHIKENKIKVPLKYKIWKLLANEVLAIYVQDSAYYDRFGGFISFLIANQHKERDVVKLIGELKKWYIEKEARVYGREWIIKFFNKVAKEYKRDAFVREATTYFLKYLEENKEDWSISFRFDPMQWFPQGKGQITFLLGGRQV